MQLGTDILLAAVDTPDPIKIRSECDFYGASRLIANALNGFSPEMFLGFWYHGWQYNPPQFLELYRWHKAPDDWPLLVHRQSEQHALARFGAKNSRAIGAPILYCNDRKVVRISNSLLIMPFHSLDYVKIKYVEAEYFKCLDSVISAFDVVAACIHPSCLSSGRWISELKKREIPYVIGAEANDGNGLKRMKQLLSRFTHVTSNWIGSHIVYAGLCGAAPSIYGPRPFFKKEEFKNDPYYNAHPHILDWWLSQENSDYVRSEYGFLFRKPHEADRCVEWSQSQLGYENMLSYSEVASLLMRAEDRKASGVRTEKNSISIRKRFCQFLKMCCNIENPRHGNRP